MKILISGDNLKVEIIKDNVFTKDISSHLVSLSKPADKKKTKIEKLTGSLNEVPKLPI